MAGSMTFQEECALHIRYRALRCHKATDLVIWCEAGVYYTPNTPLKPDWNDKRMITLEQFAELVAAEEIKKGLRKQPQSEHGQMPKLQREA